MTPSKEDKDRLDEITRCAAEEGMIEIKPREIVGLGITLLLMLAFLPVGVYIDPALGMCIGLLAFGLGLIIGINILRRANGIK